MTTDGEETLTIGGGGAMQLVQSTMPPPHSTGWCQVKTMAKWPGRACTLTGVNIDTLKASEMGEKEDLL